MKEREEFIGWMLDRIKSVTSVKELGNQYIFQIPNPHTTVKVSFEPPMVEYTVYSDKMVSVQKITEDILESLKQNVLDRIYIKRLLTIPDDLRNMVGFDSRITFNKTTGLIVIVSEYGGRVDAAALAGAVAWCNKHGYVCEWDDDDDRTACIIGTAKYAWK